tara:strand:+ start:253 stop:426 length:174 start_codon:yes stop_codon:yes gene_type:complete
LSEKSGKSGKIQEEFRVFDVRKLGIDPDQYDILGDVDAVPVAPQMDDWIEPTTIREA